MRGKQASTQRQDDGPRFIPAHAGKTLEIRPQDRTYEVHPRACGENLDVEGASRAGFGSSPRMRGKPVLPKDFTDDIGFIPAHAGKTPINASELEEITVHPRACGENWDYQDRSGFHPGSSPRMRGKHLGTRTHRRDAGFIPAHAGKTRLNLVKLIQSWVHPRACGENNLDPPILDTAIGSSPRMRGKPRELGGRRGSRWFIPAHAGKTHRGGRRRYRGRVHPRACGENKLLLNDKGTGRGSSPRMRGKRWRRRPLRSQ